MTLLYNDVRKKSMKYCKYFHFFFGKTQQKYVKLGESKKKIRKNMQ